MTLWPCSTNTETGFRLIITQTKQKANFLISARYNQLNIKNIALFHQRWAVGLRPQGGVQGVTLFFDRAVWLKNKLFQQATLWPLVQFMGVKGRFFWLLGFIFN